MTATSAKTVADLQSLVGTFNTGDVAAVNGYRNSGDLGGGSFYFEGSMPPSGAIISAASPGTTATITNATNTAPIVVTTLSAHGLVSGQAAYITGIVGNTAANDKTWIITVTGRTTFALNGSTGNGAYRSGGTSNTTTVTVSRSAAHGLVTGQQVMIAGALGNTAINGTWITTVLSETMFSIGTRSNGTYAANTAFIGDGGTIIPSSRGRWKRIYSGPISVKWFGALGDGTGSAPSSVGGVTTDQLAIQAALNFIPPQTVKSLSGTTVDVPPGQYVITAPVVIGAVTSAGTSPPVVTLTGSPNSCFLFIIKISVGGALGTAKFDWSSDRGGTYTTDITTVSSIVLGSTGVTANFSVGTYSTNNEYATIVNGVALSITNNNTVMRGVGGPPTGGSVITVKGRGTGLVIEGAGMGNFAEGVTEEYPVGNAAIAQSSQIQNLSFRGGSPQPYDVIVVHTGNVSITDCAVASCERYGIVVESGISGSVVESDLLSRLGGLLCVTQAPNNVYFVSDSWRITNSSFENCGNGRGDPTEGAAVYIHGTDASAGTASGLSAKNCNISYYAGGIGGNTWIECYSQNGQIGYYMASAFPSTFVGCGTEDFKAVHVEPGNTSVGVGGTLASYCPHAVGVYSNLEFSKLGNDGATYRAWVPGAPYYNALMATSRANITTVVATGTAPPAVRLTGTPVGEHQFIITITTAGALGAAVFKWSFDGGVSYTTGVPTAESVILGTTGIIAYFSAGTYLTDNTYTSTAHVSIWTLEYEPSVTAYPFLDSSYRLVNRIANSLYKDPYGGTFGITDIDAPRGANLHSSRTHC